MNDFSRNPHMRSEYRSRSWLRTFPLRSGSSPTCCPSATWCGRFPEQEKRADFASPYTSYFFD